MGKGVRPNCVEPVMHGLVIVMVEDGKREGGKGERDGMVGE